MMYRIGTVKNKGGKEREVYRQESEMNLYPAGYVIKDTERYDFTIMVDPTDYERKEIDKLVKSLDQKTRHSIC